MTTNRPLEGVIVPVATPFNAAEEIDEPAFVAQLEWMVTQGVHGVVVGGSTGEGYTLETDELVRLAELAIDTVGNRLPVLASIITDSTRTAVSRAQRLAGHRLAALQVAPPHYIFSPSAAGLIDFYSAVSDASAFPIVIYNVIPWAKISPTEAADIMQAVPGVIAIKQSGTDFGVYADLVHAVGGERVFAANDGALMSCYDLGAAGSIAAIATAAPKANVMLWNAVQTGRRDEAIALHRDLVEVWAALTGPNLPARVKAALALQGIDVGRPRAPMDPASAADRSRIATALTRLNS